MVEKRRAQHCISHLYDITLPCVEGRGSRSRTEEHNSKYSLLHHKYMLEKYWWKHQSQCMGWNTFPTFRISGFNLASVRISVKPSKNWLVELREEFKLNRRGVSFLGECTSRTCVPVQAEPVCRCLAIFCNFRIKHHFSIILKHKVYWYFFSQEQQEDSFFQEQQEEALFGARICAHILGSV